MHPLHRVEAAVIGTSAGGVDALATLLADLPTPWHLPLVAVIHLPERRESRLIEVFAHRLGSEFGAPTEIRSAPYQAIRVTDKQSVERLRNMSPLYEMHKEGVDLKSIQWEAH
jgi:hypothetical protein